MPARGARHPAHDHRKLPQKRAALPGWRCRSTQRCWRVPRASCGRTSSPTCRTMGTVACTRSGSASKPCSRWVHQTACAPAPSSELWLSGRTLTTFGASHLGEAQYYPHLRLENEPEIADSAAAFRQQALDRLEAHEGCVASAPLLPLTALPHMSPPLHCDGHVLLQVPIPPRRDASVVAVVGHTCAGLVSGGLLHASVVVPGAGALALWLSRALLRACGDMTRSCGCVSFWRPTSKLMSLGRRD